MNIRTRVFGAVLAMTSIVLVHGGTVWAQDKKPDSDNKALMSALQGLQGSSQPQAGNKQTTASQETQAAAPATPQASETTGDSATARLFGPWTLMHTAAAGVVPRLTFFFRAMGFRASDFLIDGRNEENTLIRGRVGIAYPIVPSFQLYGAFLSLSNKNVRDREVQTYEPPVQRAMGDILLGGRWASALPSIDGLTVGVDGSLRLYAGEGGLAPDWGATSVTFQGLASYAFMPAAAVHANVGYVLDNSYELLTGPTFDASDPTGNTELFYSYVVHRFAMDAAPSRFFFNLAAHYAHNMEVAGSTVTLVPFVEYHLMYYTSEDSNITNVDQYLEVEGTNEDRRLAQSATFGLLSSVGPVSATVGVDVALQQPGYKISPPLPPYMVFFGLSYTAPETEAKAAPASCPVCKPKVVVKEVVKTVPQKEKKLEAHIVGRVTDEKGNPVAGAYVSLPGSGMSDLLTDETGQFVTCPLKAGTYKVVVGKDGYEEATKELAVKAGAMVNVTITLKRKAAQECKVTIKVLDARKDRPIKATVRIRGNDSAGKNVTMEKGVPRDGLSITLPTGSYRLVFSSRKYLTMSRSIEFDKCPAPEVVVKLKRKPRKSYIKVRRRRIFLRRKIYFKKNTARLTEKSKLILDEIAAYLIEHPEILLVRIEGHTDNKGSDEYNLRLSQKRANAVRAYLISKGVEPKRLIAKGYGRSRPIYPNISERARAKNRRVEFHILKIRKE